ncbi:MAG: hypothetical protein ACE141_12765 [Bryobacteraceae bacterium]
MPPPIEPLTTGQCQKILGASWGEEALNRVCDEAVLLAEATVEAYLEQRERGEWPDLTRLNPPGVDEYFASIGWDLSEPEGWWKYEEEVEEATE